MKWKLFPKLVKSNPTMSSRLEEFRKQLNEIIDASSVGGIIDIDDMAKDVSDLINLYPDKTELLQSYVFDDFGNIFRNPKH